ncbi:hypothetical protein [Rhodococcus rhodnii]|uniref:Uncharacterized protein n=2 Tax=Rhodococcus rhodnii TaxID=38312 RepID=R7WKA2_9NOCA|nr:hypothetical protein [Rhodococcus rhodnii]EOM75746.1 hypothetical protein Rrhod_2912 [Rhodococcus rhodnii LMG 5362]
MRIATTIRSALAIGALAGGTLAAGTTTAAADPLPIGTFKIQTNSLECAAVAGANPPYFAAVENCGTVNLDQQFTYNLLTKQIASVGRLGYCLNANITGLNVTACDANSALQRFESQPRSSGRSTISIDFPSFGRYYLSDEGPSIQVTPSNQGIADKNYFRFPLI